MADGNELRALRKEELAAYKIVSRNKKKLDGIENRLETRKLDLMEASIEQQRLDNEYRYRYSNDPEGPTESWSHYLAAKRLLEEHISYLDEMLCKEKEAKKECYKNAEKARKNGNSGEAASWMLEAHDHLDIAKKIKTDISDDYGEIESAKRKAMQDPDYLELQTRITLAKERYAAIQQEIFDLQREAKTQKRIYDDSKKQHKSIREKIEKIEKQIYSE